jgi:hypothetical protein
MSHIRLARVLAMSALFSTLGGLSTRADNVKKVFVIAMENHN